MLTFVFSRPFYATIAVAVFAGIFVVLAVSSQFLFFEPYVTMNITSETLFEFVLTVAISAMSGMVISMNIFVLKRLKNELRKSRSGFIGSIIGLSTGACSCGLIGYVLISAFGTVGGVITSFITDYRIHLRIVALIILLYSYYATSRMLSNHCRIQVK
jgi:hypothetical protein